MKVLIVDDNRMIRRSVRAGVDWESLEMEVVGEASNGVEMAEIVEELRPDIVISDVKMPQADGFQMMDRARTAVAHLKFVMISGYDDFEYMREAIRKDVVDYLLKPVDEKELERSLGRARKRIEEERNRKEGGEEELLPHILLTKWLGNEILSPAETSRLGRWDSMMASFALINPIYAEDSPSTSLPVESAQRIASLLEMKSEGKSAVFSLGPSLLLLLQLDRPDRIRKTAADRLLDTALTELRNLDILSGLFYSLCRPFAWKELRVRYNEHKMRLYERYRNPQASGGEIPFSDLKSDLWIALKLRSEEGVRALTGRIGELMETSIADPAHLDHLIRSMADTALSLVISRELGTGDRLRFWNSPDMLLGFNDGTEMLNRLEKDLTVLVRNDRLQNDADPADLAIEYMHHSYAEPLTLEQLSSMFHINRVYLGQLIKKKTGMSFNRLLNHLRIEQAKGLILSDPDLKFSLIASRVGYSDVHYFSRIFKKEVRLSPKEFREKGPQAES
jgi:two-component system response regulator YesN